MIRLRIQHALDMHRDRRVAVGSFRWWLLPAVLCFAVLCSTISTQVQAQTPLPSSEADAIYQRLEKQDAEIEWLRSQLLLPRESATNPTTPIGEAMDPQAIEDPVLVSPVEQTLSQPVSAKPEKDASTDVAADKWTVKLGGQIQLDYVTWANADPAIVGARNYFSYRRLRLIADGTGYGQFDFRLQLSLEPGQGLNQDVFTTPEVKDAYVSMNEIPWFGRFRIGNFFVPFSLEQVTNDTNNIFTERSIPTQGVFTADREVGIALYNCTDDEYITWTGGLFFDDISDSIKTRLDDNQGYRLSGRLTGLPYYDEASKGRYLLHTGVGILHTDDFDDLARFRARPQIQRGPFLIDSGILRADSYTTGNVETAVVWGPISIQSEAFLCGVQMLEQEMLHIGGAYVYLSYFLTGESRVFEKFGQHGAQFGRNKPFTNLAWTRCRHGCGAWEAKTRWSYLDLTDAAQGQYNDLTAGFNWYWTDRMRIMFDWIHPYTDSQTIFGATESDLLAMRFDVNW